MRTTVAPADGPVLLLFAFEAVIIGGMGSFWGTFAGGMLLGVTQAIGFRLDPGLGHLVRPHRVPRGAGRAAAGAVPEDPRVTMDAARRPSSCKRGARPRQRRRVVRGTPARGAALAVGLLLVAVAARCRWWAPAEHARLDARVRRDRLLLHLRDDVEPARRLRRHGLDRPAGLLRPRRLRAAGARQLRRRESLRRGAAAARSPLAAALPVSRVAFRLAGRLLRDRHLGHRRSVPPQRRQRLRGRRRLGHQPDRAARHREGDARDRSPSGCAWPAWSPSVALVYLVPAHAAQGLALLAIRDSEVAAESQGVDVRAHQARGLRRRGLRLRAGRRALLPRQPAHLAPMRRSASTGPRSRSSSS